MTHIYAKINLKGGMAQNPVTWALTPLEHWGGGSQVERRRRENRGELIVRNRKLQVSKLSFEGCFVQLLN